MHYNLSPGESLEFRIKLLEYTLQYILL